jgi:hypothetical protein
MKNKRQNIELELLVTTSSNSHVEVTVRAPLLFPGQILGYTEIRRGQIEKITLDKSLSGEKVEHSNKGVLRMTFHLLSLKMTFNLLLIFHSNSWISTFVICVYQFL